MRIAGQPASYTSPSPAGVRLAAAPARAARRRRAGGAYRRWAARSRCGSSPRRLGIPALWIPAANSDNQQHDVNEHYVLRHFFLQTALYADVVGSRPA